MMRNEDKSKKQLIKEINELRENVPNIRQVEEELRLNQQILGYMEEGVYLIKASDGTIVYTNPKFESIFGYESDEILGKNVSIVNAPTDKSPEETARTIIEALNDTGKWSGEVRNVKKDGTTFWCHADVSVFEHVKHGKVWLSVHRDITVSKHIEESLLISEKKYKTLFTQAADSILLVDAEKGELIDFNDKAYENLGYTREEFKDLEIPDFEAIESIEEVKQRIKNIFENGSDIFETKHRRKDGEIRNIMVNSRLIPCSGSRIIQSICRDITDIKRLEESLQNASLAKNEFLASMSHEIRTPMTSIIGMVEFMSDSPLNYDQQSAMRTLRGASESLLALIDDILDLSKIEAGHLELDDEVFNLETTIAEIGSFMGVIAKGKGIELSHHLDPDVPSNVLGDSKRLRQIICNLLINAVKFTEKGRIDLKVSNKGTKDDITELEFYVKDTGIGIPEGKLDIIFERFTQVNSSTTRDFGGTGLGTAISKFLIEAMGGRIWVESEVGKGSTFYFTVKMKTTEAVEGEKVIKREVKKKTITWKRPLKILIAEDSEDNINLILMHLNKTPHILDTAENGKLAVDKFQTDNYDLVLMDMEMPVMDGYTATEEIRKWEAEKERKPTPIVALTAHALKEHKQKSMDAGCTRHVTKPFKKQKLLETIYKSTN